MPTTPDTSPDFPVPEGFFEEIAAALRTETAEDIAETVIAACISRGIVHPDLEEDPDDELRAVQMGEVFAAAAEMLRTGCDQPAPAVVPGR